MFGYLITTIAGIFWIFRLIITILYTAGNEFMIVPINMTFEIINLFVSFICIILVAKRNMLGAIMYLIMHCAYFGYYIYREATLENINNLNLFIALIGVIIPFLAFANIGLSSGKKGTIKNRKTDWFYATEEYERKLDERADKNQYKIK